jgi:hypothetical protein
MERKKVKDVSLLSNCALREGKKRNEKLNFSREREREK